MIAIRRYKTLWDYIVSQVQYIEKVFYVDDESELSKKISEVENRCIFLVVVTPSSDLVATDDDNYADIDTCVIYLLMKVDPRDQTDEDLMDERALTQSLMFKIRNWMITLAGREDGSDLAQLMRQVIRGKQHIDRERNYLGCNGYSLSFSLKTNGL